MFALGGDKIKVKRFVCNVNVKDQIEISGFLVF